MNKVNKCFFFTLVLVFFTLFAFLLKNLSEKLVAGGILGLAVPATILLAILAVIYLLSGAPRPSLPTLPTVPTVNWWWVIKNSLIGIIILTLIYAGYYYRGDISNGFSFGISSISQISPADPRNEKDAHQQKEKWVCWWRETSNPGNKPSKIKYLELEAEIIICNENTLKFIARNTENGAVGEFCGNKTRSSNGYYSGKWVQKDPIIVGHWGLKRKSPKKFSGFYIGSAGERGDLFLESK